MKYLLTTFLFIAYVASAATFYVDYSAGDDALSGTSQVNAWKHIPGDSTATSTPHGAMIAGDTIYVKGGVVYNILNANGILVDGTHYQSNGVSILSGDAIGWGTGRAVFDGAGVSTRIIDVEEINFVTLRGFEARNTLGHDGNECILLHNGSSSNVCDHLLIHDIGTNSTGPGAYCRKDGIAGSSGGGYNLVTNCIIYNTTQKNIEFGSGCNSNTIVNNLCGISSDHSIAISSDANIVSGNYLTNNYPTVVSILGEPFNFGYGIKMAANVSTASRNRIYNNVIIGWPGGIFMEDVGGSGGDMTNNLVANNSIADFGANANYLGIIGWHVISNYSHIGSIVVNNLVVSSRTNDGSYYAVGPRVSGSGFFGTNTAIIGTNNFVGYNCWFAMNGQTMKPMIYFNPSTKQPTFANFSDTGTSSPDYRFTNASAGTGNSFAGDQFFNVDPLVVGWYTNLSLLPTSPVKLAGTNLSSYFSTDCSGITRHVWSIGAYEFQLPASIVMSGVTASGVTAH